MRCPYCLENFNANTEIATLFNSTHDGDRQYATETMTCSNSRCGHQIVYLRTTVFPDNTGMPPGFTDPPYTIRKLIVPAHEARPNVMIADVDEIFHEDYQEAIAVLPTSAKASAALSRRLLQNLLREKMGVKYQDLSNEIDEAISSTVLPSRITQMLDAVRVVGNFAAHPIKSSNTGEIQDVEPGEAELNLDVIESLFDQLFTAPRIDQERIESINKKLKEAGKPTIQESIALRDKKKKKSEK